MLNVVCVYVCVECMCLCVDGGGGGGLTRKQQTNLSFQDHLIAAGKTVLFILNGENLLWSGMDIKCPRNIIN